MFLLAFVLAGCSGGNSGNSDEKPIDMNDFKSKASYAVGMDIANSLSRIKGDLDHPALLRGLRDGLAAGDMLLSAEEAMQVVQEFSQQIQSRQAQENETAMVENLQKSKEFLEQNATQPGVITTESGLQYIVETEGDGPSPAKDDQVKVNYQGTLLDGTEFDSSYKRGQPAVFGVSNLIRGWSEALQLMKVGGKYKLFIPPDLAYGAQGNATIPPNSTLIFEVELLGIEGQE
jgi:FKBP-type peptidyl-prolyl cis-trans isomerase